MSGELNDLNVTASQLKMKYSLKFKVYIKSKVPVFVS